MPGARAVPVDRLEDLVGELCNRILGRINAFFAKQGATSEELRRLAIFSPVIGSAAKEGETLARAARRTIIFIKTP